MQCYYISTLKTYRQEIQNGLQETVLDSKNALHLGDTEVTDQGHFKQRTVWLCVFITFNIFFIIF